MNISGLFGGYLKQNEVNHLTETSYDKNVVFGLFELLDWSLNGSKGNTVVLCICTHA